MDKYVTRILMQRNITLSWMGKVTYRSENTEELANTFEEMSRHDPHIIISNSDSPMSVACFMHRYNLVGARYKVFVTYWTVIDASTPIPDFLQPWCTHEMVKEILPNMFFYGDAAIADVAGRQTKDATNMTFDDFWINLRSKLVRPEESYAWGYWPPLCYDRGLLAGTILNRTETILRSMNQTLLHWTTSSVNFKSNPEFIEEVLRQAMLSVDVVGKKAHYQMNSSSSVNSGYGPYTFSQYQNDPPEMKIVAYYKSNEANPLVVSRPIVWHTSNGLPPKDSLTTVDVAVPMISLASYSVLLGKLCSVRSISPHLMFPRSF